MSLLGKLLAVFNVLAAIAFVCLAAADYGRRHAWAYAVFTHDLAINGLPFDAKEIDADGNVIVNDLTDTTLKNLFAQAGGQPVRTQVQEVEALRTRLQAAIDDPNVKGTHEQKLATALLPLALTATQRDALLKRQANAGDAPAADLQAQFNEAFAEVLEAQTSPPGGSPHQRAEAERRQGAAHLLVSLRDTLTTDAGAAPTGSPLETPSFRRAVVVVGLAGMLRELDSEVALQQQMAGDTALLTARDRDTYLQEQRRLLATALDLSDELQKQTLAKNAQVDQKVRQEDQVKARSVEVDDVKKQIAHERATTQTLLNAQAIMEKDLYNALTRLRDTNGGNQKLEETIRQLEQNKAR
jgi:hypothetical protein